MICDWKCISKFLSKNSDSVIYDNAILILWGKRYYSIKILIKLQPRWPRLLRRPKTRNEFYDFFWLPFVLRKLKGTEAVICAFLFILRWSFNVIEFWCYFYIISSNKDSFYMHYTKVLPMVLEVYEEGKKLNEENGEYNFLVSFVKKWFKKFHKVN